jgi:hypothetical protein
MRAGPGPWPGAGRSAARGRARVTVTIPVPDDSDDQGGSAPSHCCRRARDSTGLRECAIPDGSEDERDPERAAGGPAQEPASGQWWKQGGAEQQRNKQRNKQRNTRRLYRLRSRCPCVSRAPGLVPRSESIVMPGRCPRGRRRRPAAAHPVRASRHTRAAWGGAAHGVEQEGPLQAAGSGPPRKPAPLRPMLPDPVGRGRAGGRGCVIRVRGRPHPDRVRVGLAPPVHRKNRTGQSPRCGCPSPPAAVSRRHRDRQPRAIDENDSA